MQPAGWRCQHLGTRLYRKSCVDSTQLEAARLLASGAPGGTVVVASQQTAGRGRLGRTWQSPPGNLYFSVMLNPARPMAAWPLLSPLAALALAETLDALDVREVALKWPNDVLVSGKKVAGILAEIVDITLIVGVGINVNAVLPAALSGATTLQRETGSRLDLDDLLRVCLESLDGLYDRWNQGEDFTARWAARLTTLGLPIQVRMGERIVSGLAEGITDEGALVLRLADGRHEICHAGDGSLSGSECLA